MNAFTGPMPLLRQEIGETAACQFWRRWHGVCMASLALLECIRLTFTTAGLATTGLVASTVLGMGLTCAVYAAAIHAVAFTADVVLASIRLRAWRDAIFMFVALAGIVTVGVAEAYMHSAALFVTTTGAGLDDAAVRDVVTMNDRLYEIDRQQTEHFKTAVATRWAQAEQSRQGRDGTNDKRCGELCAASERAARKLTLDFDVLGKEALSANGAAPPPVTDPTAAAAAYQQLRKNMEAMDVKTAIYQQFCRAVGAAECPNAAQRLRESPEYIRAARMLGNGRTADRSARVRAYLHEQISAALNGTIQIEAAVHLAAALLPGTLVLIMVLLTRYARQRRDSLLEDIEAARLRVAEADELYRIQLRRSVDQTVRGF